jgi:hypothetical protein
MGSNELLYDFSVFSVSPAEAGTSHTNGDCIHVPILSIRKGLVKSLIAFSHFCLIIKILWKIWKT